MAIACLHNFFRRNSDSAEIYIPSGTFDYEENGEWLKAVGETWVMKIWLISY